MRAEFSRVTSCWEHTEKDCTTTVGKPECLLVAADEVHGVGGKVTQVFFISCSFAYTENKGYMLKFETPESPSLREIRQREIN